MKKIVLLGLTFAIFAITVSAQTGRDEIRKDRDGIRKERVDRKFKSDQLTRGEKFKLHKNDREYSRAKRHAYRDGKLNRFEKRKLTKMRKSDRRQTYRYKHNNRGRVI